MNVHLVSEAARIQQELRRMRVSIEALEARMDELAAKIAEESAHALPPNRFTDLEGIWVGAEFSEAQIKAARYQVQETSL